MRFCFKKNLPAWILTRILILAVLILKLKNVALYPHSRPVLNSLLQKMARLLFKYFCTLILSKSILKQYLNDKMNNRTKKPILLQKFYRVAVIWRTTVKSKMYLTCRLLSTTVYCNQGRVLTGFFTPVHHLKILE